MTILINPNHFLADPQVKPFYRDKRQDLTAGNVPTTSPGEYVVFSEKVPHGQVLIIKAIVPYAVERTFIGGPDFESFRMLDPVQANGFFLFQPRVSGGAPFILETDYNLPETQALPPNDLDRARGPGISYISQHPYEQAMQSWFNPLFSILVPGDTTFYIAFSLLPSALPAGGQFAVGGNEATAKRVDFAGAVVVGQQMSEQSYHDYEQRYGIAPGHRTSI